MATTRASTTKKTTAAKKTTSTKKATVKKEILEQESEQKVQESKEEVKVEPKIFGEHDLIPCYSMFPGTVVMVGRRTGNVYMWEEMGVEEYVEYVDLISEVRNRRSSYIYDPLIVVDDEDFLNQNERVKSLYEDVYTPDEIQKAIKEKDIDLMVNFIKSLPKGIASGIPNVVVTMMDDGSLDSMRKIKAIDKLFGTELSTQADFYF